MSSNVISNPDPPSPSRKKIQGAGSDLLDLTQLRSFAMALEAGSFSLAAKRLGVTQPAVSLRVRQLERRLGVRLIERVSGGMKATPAGALVRKHFSVIDSAHSALLGALEVDATEQRQTVNLGGHPTACLHFLPQLLGRLRLDQPRLAVTLASANSAECAARVLDGTLDLAIVSLPITAASLSCTVFLHDEFVVICGKDLPAIKPRITASDLHAAQLLLPERPRQSRRLIDIWLANEYGAPEPAMELGCFESIRELAAAGLGYGFVPGMSVRSAVALASVQVARLEPRLEWTWSVVTRKSVPVSPAVALVHDAIVATGAMAHAQ
ncbi:DNA-binding transcriptional regulator, LysR family [Variovorax sp. YR752]|uniref:LysR family transcriptional regulator n=1 Tax=Variovorax sp. YR752 TaxID=1884383 RepID=UPI000BC484F2|nr:LysR family transcriptional regulator [Variovorax sp. YR752]SOE06200.1 DNA-binding transcriptional regulator, LysR family [Variovorax sp. YR752]